VTVKVDNESLYNLLSSKADTQLIRPQFFPQDFLGGRHLTVQVFQALEINNRQVL
jgi:hypothetical protein